MKVIVGLGNPGEKYHRNRHNVGFIFVDYVLEKFSVASSQFLDKTAVFKFEKKLESEIVKLLSDSEEIILAKPQTFMNESGRAVKKMLSFFSGQLSALYVVHDDLDIPLGEYKIQLGKGPKLHNGIESIEQHLGTKDFWRVRVGVDNRQADNRIPGKAYVLQNFTELEIDSLKRVFAAIYGDMLKLIPN